MTVVSRFLIFQIKNGVKFSRMNIETLLSALAVSPENIPLNLLLAEAYKADLNFDQAKAIYLKVLTLDSNHKDTQLKLIEVLDLQGELSEAVVRIESFCQNFPDFGEAWVLRARLSFKDDEIGKAREYYQIAMALSSKLKDEGLEKEIGYVDEIEEITDPQVGVGAQDWSPEAIGSPTNAPPNSKNEFDFLSEIEYTKEVDVDFDHVGGMSEVKNDIRMKIIHPLNNPDLFEAYGKKPGGGVLLYGPPGCGKTLISKATAGEIHSSFYSVGLHQILDMWLGKSEEKLHQVFELARKQAPSVLFFDEIDALAADRSDLKGSAGRTLINQFLAELDGAHSKNDGLLILGATNAPWHLDSAFLRPGRFDRVVFVPPPDQEARISILDILSQGKPIDSSSFKSLAKKTEGFSGADLEAIIDVATEKTIEEAMKSGKIIPISERILLKARKEVKASTLRWFESAKNYAMFANQSGMYDDIITYMGIKKP
jgi:AAA+ superfamily predicted ATPase